MDAVSSLMELRGGMMDSIKVTGYSYARSAKLSSLTKNLWYEEREQLDSGGGGTLGQGAGHDGSFF